MVGGSNLFNITPNGSRAMMLPLSQSRITLNQQLRINFTGDVAQFVHARCALSVVRGGKNLLGVGCR